VLVMAGGGKQAAVALRGFHLLVAFRRAEKFRVGLLADFKGVRGAGRLVLQTGENGIFQGYAGQPGGQVVR
jgi:hypothetical protein